MQPAGRLLEPLFIFGRQGPLPRAAPEALVAGEQQGLGLGKGCLVHGSGRLSCLGVCFVSPIGLAGVYRGVRVPGTGRCWDRQRNVVADAEAIERGCPGRTAPAVLATESVPPTPCPESNPAQPRIASPTSGSIAAKLPRIVPPPWVISTTPAARPQPPGSGTPPRPTCTLPPGR